MYSLRLLLRNTALTWALWLASSGQAAQPSIFSPVKDCKVLLAKLDKRPFDSSIEIEVSASNNMLTLFTTTDGTVGPVLRGVEPPSDIKKHMMEEYPEYKKFEDIPWDAFTSQYQRRILLNAAQQTDVNFFNDRTIHGLTPKDEGTLSFRHRTTFFGKSYAAGTHKINPRDVLTDEIHFRGPKDIQADADPKNFGIEMHFRTNESPGDNLTQAWTFMKGMGHQEGSVHQHVVSKLPEALSGPERLLSAIKITEYHRRVNTYAEMNTIIEGHSVLANREGIIAILILGVLSSEISILDMTEKS